MRIRYVRIAFQIFFFTLFTWLVFATWITRLDGWPVSLFLDMDPLIMVTTAITTHSVYSPFHGALTVGSLGLIFGLILFVVTAVFGRVFCNWMCPYGILHHFIGWVFNKRTMKERYDSNRYMKLQHVKYYVLFFVLGAAVFGSLQVGLLDPICLLYRSFSTALLPVADAVTRGSLTSAGFDPIYPKDTHLYLGGWFIGFMLFGLVAANLVIPRFFCRVLCPLGAFLGVLSRFSLYRIHRDPIKCTDCDICLKGCEGASDPHLDLRKSECFVCFNCIDDCPEDALSFEFNAPAWGEIKEADVPPRRAAIAGIAGLLFTPMARLSGKSGKAFSKEVIRPPGSVEERLFLERCIKCDQCIRVCPTNVLQPAVGEAGIEGLWTPILDMKVGYCDVNCTLCGQVCPTGAIQKMTPAQKNGVDEYRGKREQMSIGTAFYDRGRCLPWGMDTPCVVCEEVCPTSPKAIFSREETITTRKGEDLVLRLPYVDPKLCIGCGICEHECPVTDERAIRVSAVGETRSRDVKEKDHSRSLLLEGQYGKDD